VAAVVVVALEELAVVSPAVVKAGALRELPPSADAPLVVPTEPGLAELRRSQSWDSISASLPD
jgi:hypothetical protein